MAEHTHSEHESNNSWFSHMKPKTTFFLGMGSALVFFFVVGFFILLGIMLKGDSGDDKNGDKKAAPTAQVNPTPQAGEPAPRAGAEGLPAVTDTDWTRGEKDAPVTIVEYSDLECPFCKRLHPTLKQVIAEYDGKVNWVYRHFPLVNLHSKATKEAEATECAGELGGNDGFWKLLDKIYEVTPANNGLDLAKLPEYAQEMGLDKEAFTACLESGKYTQKVQDQAQGAVLAGGAGTPYNVVVKGDTKIPVSGAVPFENFKNIIDPLLK
ncbi:MAG: DsbA family protein [Patescibacteria group bacterium]